MGQETLNPVKKKKSYKIKKNILEIGIESTEGPLHQHTNTNQAPKTTMYIVFDKAILQFLYVENVEIERIKFGEDLVQ